MVTPVLLIALGVGLWVAAGRADGPTVEVIAPTGLILKRGHDLKKVLRVIDPSLRLVQV